LDRLLKRVPATDEATRILVLGAASLTLILLPLWTARVNIRLAVEKGYTDFIRRDHIYPVFAPDKAIQDARKILNRVEQNAIVFADWDKLYSYVYTAQFEAGRKDVTFHEAYITETPSLAETTLAYIDANIDTRPIYFAVFMEELDERYLVEQVGDALYRIRRK
jgi:hypothetical protein